MAQQSFVPGEDGSVLVPGVSGLVSIVDGTWTVTRTALGNYNLVRTAASSAAHLVLNLSSVFGMLRAGTPNAPTNPGNAGNSYPMPPGLGGSGDTGNVSAPVVSLTNLIAAPALKGQRYDYRDPYLTSIDVIYILGTADLSGSHTLALSQTTYAVGAAASVAAKQAATAVGLVHATTLAVTNIAVTTPYEIHANGDVADFAELIVDDTGGGTTTYALYGFNVYFKYAR